MSPWVKKFLFSKDSPEAAEQAEDDLNATLKALGQTENNVVHIIHRFIPALANGKDRKWWEIWMHTWKDDD